MENKVRMKKNVYNVKSGDMFTVKGVGSAILTKETRAYWTYLFRDRLNKIKKIHFWQGVDCEEIEISYASNKKYRRLQKRYRSIDVRDVPNAAIEKEINSFLDFISYPCFVILGEQYREKFEHVRRTLEDRELEYFEDLAVSPEIEPVIRVVGEN